MIAQHALAVRTLDADLHSRYLSLIEQRLGLQLSKQQALAIPFAVSEVLRKSDQATADELYAVLATTDNSALMDLLGADLTIGETHFFRIAPQIEALRTVVLPDIMARRAGTRRLNIWSAGCSTGEEAYTLAMLVREMLPASDHWEVQLFGTDLSDRAIATAREAVYGEWSFRETPESARARYFTRDGTRWRLSESIKRMVRFSHLNLMADVFPSTGPAGPGLDLILCRNVTIYFSQEACRSLYRRLGNALSPGGWLALGPSDPTPSRQTLLEPTSVGGAIFWRRVTAPDPGEASAVASPTPTYRPLAPAQAGRRVRSSAAAGPGFERPGPSRIAPPNPVPDPIASDVAAHLSLGLKRLDAGAVEEAIASLRRAAYLDSAHSLTQFSLGKAYLHAGDAPRARAAFRHARRLLAAAPTDQEIEVGGEMTTGELRFAVEAHLAALGGVGEP